MTLLIEIRNTYVLMNASTPHDSFDPTFVFGANRRLQHSSILSLAVKISAWRGREYESEKRRRKGLNKSTQFLSPISGKTLRNGMHVQTIPVFYRASIPFSSMGGWTEEIPE